MKTQVKVITPAWAKNVLETQNTNNRPISHTRVKSLVSDMKAGAFMLNHQGIAFDDSERLIDGQHRLTAIVEFGKPVPMLVTTGIPAEQKNGVVLNVMDTVDRNGVRGVGQQLNLSHGYTNGNNVAAAARIVMGICSTSGVGGRVSTAQTLHVLKHYGEHIEFILSRPWQKQLRRAPVIGTLAFCRPVDQAKVDLFADKLATMENVAARSPVMALHRWTMNHGEGKGGSQVMVICRVVATCLQKFLQGKTLEKTSGSDEALDYFRNQQKQSVRLINELTAGGA